MADTSLTTQSGAALEKKSLKDKVGGFFAEVQREMKKVTWPSREHLQDSTVVTLVMTVVIALFVFGVDKVFEIVLRLVYNL